MDFYLVDNVFCDDLDRGDIIEGDVDGEYYQVTGPSEDDGDVLSVPVTCLTSTEGEDILILDPAARIDLYRSV